MRRLIGAIVGGCALAGGSAQAAAVEVRDAAARISVIAEARRDVKVEIAHANPRLPIAIRKGMSGQVVVDGGLDHRIRGCHTSTGAPGAIVGGLGDVAWDDLPVIVIRTPRAVQIAVGGAVFGEIGRAASVDLSSAGCGDWSVANVTGRLRLIHAGSGDVRAGSAGSVSLRVAGSGDVTVAPVAGPVRVDVAGSGAVHVAAVQGPLDVHVAGSGDVTVTGGRASTMTVSVVGSGDVDFGGVAGSLKAEIAGSGDVRARQVTGAVQKRVLGSGAVRIGQQKPPRPPV